MCVLLADSQGMLFFFFFFFTGIIAFVQLETEPPTIQAGVHKDGSAATILAASNVLQFLEIMA